MTETTNPIFIVAMDAAVRLRLIDMKEAGFVLDKERIAELPEICDALGGRGDVLMYGSKKKGECADLFNKTAKAIAYLAYVPGGIDIFGQHYEVKPEVKESEAVEWL